MTLCWHHCKPMQRCASPAVANMKQQGALPYCVAWWMVVMIERPPAASWHRDATKFIAVVESRPEVGSAQRHFGLGNRWCNTWDC